MKQDITFTNFVDAFNAMDRADQFTYDGKKALYEYLTDLEEDCGVEVELDVIALCCEYTEYENLEEIKETYSNMDIDGIEDLMDHTQVIAYDTGIIISDF